MTIAYLDPDDEITSAVARLRASDEIRVVLVLPPGSRIATSRINFRLLAREAREHQRRLSIVSGEPSVRAVSISAGLPAYGSVADYEAALAETRAAGDTAAAASALTGAPATGTPPAGAVEVLASSEAPASPEAPASREAPGEAEADSAPAGLPTEAIPVAAASAASAGATASTRAAGSVAAASSMAGEGTAAVPMGEMGAVRRGPALALPVVAGRATLALGGRAGPWALASLGLLAAIVLVVLAGLLILPSATITVVPQAEAAPAAKLTVAIDPTITTVDVAAGVVPAQTVSVPLTATSQFQATGKNVTETKATGSVTFLNFNFLADGATTIRSGSVVRTPGGVGFATQATITVPRARRVGNTVVPSQRDVAVTAVLAGTSGNVPGGAISVVPRGYDSSALQVSNLAPISGGTHTETPRVAQKDYDDATRTLTASLTAQLDGAVANPATAPAGTTLIPATAALGPVTAEPQASSVVGKEQATFELTLSASGTVYAVDQAQLEQIATERLKSAVPAGYELFPDSIKTSVGAANVDGGKISAPVEASGEMARTLDEAALLAQVKGKSVSEAQAILAPYGNVTVDTWPFYVGSIPTLDGRATLTVSPPQRSGT